LNFLVDTGASASVIDQSTARHIGLKLGDRVRVAGVQTVTTGYWPQRIAATVGEKIPLPRNLLAIDLATFSGACAKPVDGLLGADFFHGKVVQIDFREHVIRLLTPEQGRKLRGASLPLETRSCGMRVPVSVNAGKPQWLRVDTGCAAALHWVTTSVEPARCGRQVAIGLAELSLPTTTVSAELGSAKFDRVAAVIHEREIFAGEAGLLGLGLLSKFAQVTIDSKAKRLILAR
jgi:hypothetical protein